MDGFDEVEKIPDPQWKELTDEQQDAHNRRIEAEKEYDATLTLTAPIVLFIAGAFIGLLGVITVLMGVLGGFLCFLAIMWAIMRVIDRAHRYQRVRDAEVEFNRVMASK